MWEEVYKSACADFDVTPRDELLFIADGTVRLEGNTFENFSRRFTDDELLALSATCSRLPLVAELHLSYNHLTSVGAIALADAMQNGFSTLQYVDLSYNSIEADGANAIATAAATHETLSTLLLRGNPIGGDCGLCIEQLLLNGNGKNNSSNLMILDLENTEQDMKSLVHISRGLLPNLTLKTLNLGRPLMSDPDDVTYVLHHLGLALKDNKTLQNLFLNHFNITDDDLKQFVLTLCNSAVISLSLKGNQLSQESGATLANLLVHRPDFLFIDITANRLRDVGAVSLADAVAKHPTLRMLHMGSNTIGGHGISAIAKAVGANNSLVSLRLWGNDFSDESVAELYAHREKIELFSDVDFSFYIVDGSPRLARE